MLLEHKKHFRTMRQDGNWGESVEEVGCCVATLFMACYSVHGMHLWFRESSHSAEKSRATKDRLCATKFLAVDNVVLHKECKTPSCGTSHIADSGNIMSRLQRWHRAGVRGLWATEGPQLPVPNRI